MSSAAPPPMTRAKMRYIAGQQRSATTSGSSDKDSEYACPDHSMCSGKSSTAKNATAMTAIASTTVGEERRACTDANVARPVPSVSMTALTPIKRPCALKRGGTVMPRRRATRQAHVALDHVALDQV